MFILAYYITVFVRVNSFSFKTPLFHRLYIRFRRNFSKIFSKNLFNSPCKISQCIIQYNLVFSLKKS